MDASSSPAGFSAPHVPSAHKGCVLDLQLGQREWHRESSMIAHTHRCLHHALHHGFHKQLLERRGFGKDLKFDQVRLNLVYG